MTTDRNIQKLVFMYSTNLYRSSKFDAPFTPINFVYFAAWLSVFLQLVNNLWETQSFDKDLFCNDRIVPPKTLWQVC